MRTRYGIYALAFSAILLQGKPAAALNRETEALLKLLEKKGVLSSQEVGELREEVAQASFAPEEKAAVAAAPPPEAAEPEITHFHSVQSISDRMDKLEKDLHTGGWGVISDKLKLGGVIEVEAGGERRENAAAGTDSSTNDLVLAKAALSMDLRANENISARLVAQYEEGEENDHLFLDEGILFFSGGENCPYSMQGGRLYVPFGHFESHFVSDPITLTLGETRDTALVASYGAGIANVSLGGFRGEVKETGSDDRINTYVASLGLTLPENMVPDLRLAMGASYISNIAESKSLRDTGSGEGLSAASIGEYVGGQSAFVSLAFLDKYFLDAEYLGATSHFLPGDLAFDGGVALRPEAWNVELAYAMTERLEFAARYEGSRDYAGIQPERQLGLAVLYRVLANTALTLEYLSGRFENDDERDSAAGQLSISF